MSLRYLSRRGIIVAQAFHTNRKKLMHRTEIYIREDQKDILQDYSYYLTKMKKERITISCLIREALDMWIKSSQLPKDVKPNIQLKKEKEGE